MQTNSLLGSATYSPEDNKIRFYPDARLSKEDYDRARSAGFKWAPKQELFVAPMWTPDREDLMIEWCGGLGDEDKSLVERQEERADRFRDYSSNRAKDADQAHKAVSAIADNIPLGQPILVGRHSERRARRDAEKIENGMRKAIRMWDQSQYWKARAASAISHAKYKEIPAVRARRIKGLEAEQRKAQRYQQKNKTCLKFWKGELTVENTKTGQKGIPKPVNRENALWFANYYDDHAPIKLADGREAYCVWSALDRNLMCVEEIQPIRIDQAQRMIAHWQRWIDHYENRLTYERAMLAQDGGTAADQNAPEVGGACRCWCNDGWSKIIKVNKVSVTVLDNWGNGGADFTRTVPFTDLKGVMTRAAVDQVGAAGRIVGETARNFHLLRETAEPVPVKTSCPPPVPAAFDAMRQSLAAGIKVVSANQLFPTPSDLVDRLLDLADLTSGDRVLEPSAGTGALCKAILARGIFRSDLVAIELNHALIETLKLSAGEVVQGDFLELAGAMGQEFDKVIMNPPFEKGADIKHIRAAFNLLRPGGILVAICANSPSRSDALESIFDQWIDLPAGSFKTSGTSVNTAIVVCSKT